MVPINHAWPFTSGRNTSVTHATTLHQIKPCGGKVYFKERAGK